MVPGFKSQSLRHFPGLPPAGPLVTRELPLAAGRQPGTLNACRSANRRARHRWAVPGAKVRGGVPERPNGPALKAVRGAIPRGLESHPLRSSSPPTWEPRQPAPAPQWAPQPHTWKDAREDKWARPESGAGETLRESEPGSLKLTFPASRVPSMTRFSPERQKGRLGPGVPPGATWDLPPVSQPRQKARRLRLIWRPHRHAVDLLDRLRALS